MDPGPVLDYAPPPKPPRAGQAGCLIAVGGVAWVMVIYALVPIADDGYIAPTWLKWVVTLGHLAATVAMFSAARGGGIPRRVLAILAATLVSFWALLQIVVVWIWN